MTARSTWKSVERRICRALGGERNPLSGLCSRHTAADCINTGNLFVEIKHRKRIPFYKEWKEVKKLAKKEGKIPIIVIHEKNGRDYIVMVELKDFVKILKRGDLVARY